MKLNADYCEKMMESVFVKKTAFGKDAHLTDEEKDFVASIDNSDLCEECRVLPPPHMTTVEHLEAWINGLKSRVTKLENGLNTKHLDKDDFKELQTMLQQLKEGSEREATKLVDLTVQVKDLDTDYRSHIVKLLKADNELEHRVAELDRQVGDYVQGFRQAGIEKRIAELKQGFKNFTSNHEVSENNQNRKITEVDETVHRQIDRHLKVERQVEEMLKRLATLELQTQAPQTLNGIVPMLPQTMPVWWYAGTMPLAMGVPPVNAGRTNE